MRRSSAVKLTLLPMLASVTVAAQPAAGDEPPLAPPGAAEPMLSPPGLTPTIDDCRRHPDDERCPPELDDGAPVACVDGGPCRIHWVFRGGFGHYFWVSGG